MNPDPLPLSQAVRPTLVGNYVRTASLLVIALCVAGATLAMLKHLVAPLLVAVFLFFLIKPAVDRLSRWRAPPWVVVTFFLAFSFVVVMAMVEIVYSNVRAFEARIPEYREKAIRTLESYYRMTGIARPGDKDKEKEESETEPARDSEAPATPTGAAGEDAVREVGTAEGTTAAVVSPAARPKEPTLGDLIDFPWQSAVEYAFGSAVGFLEGALMTLFYLMFLFLEANKLPKRVTRGFPAEDASHYLSVGQNINHSIERYVVLKTYISLGLAVTTGVICMAFGLDFWILWAVAMFVGNYITYLGSVAALGPPIVLAFLQFSPWTAVALTTLLIVNRLAWIDYVEIRFLGRQLNLSPIVLLFSIALFGFLWGAAGMVLAVPLVTSTKIVLSHFENTRRYAVLMSED